MIKYVNATALKEKFCESCSHQNPCIICLIHHFFNDAPAADVAEVVRCKDCKHSRSDEFEPLWCYVSETCDPVKGDHFCGYGERRDE